MDLGEVSEKTNQEGGGLGVDLEVFPSPQPEVTGTLVHQQPVPIEEAG